MKNLAYLISLIFNIASFHLLAQEDTIVQKCTDRAVFGNVENFRFPKPTLLILEYTNSDKTIDKAYYHYEGGVLNGGYYVIAGTNICIDSGAYANGLREGISIVRDRRDGHLTYQAIFHKGMANGEYKAWGQNGKLEYAAFYNDGIKNGKEINYYDNGQKAEEITFKNDVIIDTIHTWNRNGDKMKVSFCDSAQYKCHEIYYDSFVENFGIGKLDFYTGLFPQGDSDTKRWKEHWDSIRKPYYLYEQRNDKTPATYAHGGYVSLADPSFLETTIGFPVQVLLMKEEKGWYQVMIGYSYSTNYPIQLRKLWIKKSALNCGYTPWEKFLVDVKYCKIYDLKSNHILKSPNINSELVSCQTDDCLIIKEVVGDWIKVSIIPNSDCRSNYNFPNDCEGWIRWRNAHQLLINRG